MTNDEFERRLAALEAEQAERRAQRDATAIQLADLAKQIGREFAAALRGPSAQDLARIVRRGEDTLRRSGGITGYAKGGLVGGEHNWIDATTMNDQAENQTAELCTRCGHGRVTKNGQVYGGTFPCDGVPRPQPERT